MRPGRRAGAASAAAGAAACAMLAAACSSGPGKPAQSPSVSTSQQLAHERSVDAPPMLVQCVLNRHVAAVADSARHYNARLPGAERWLHGGQIGLTDANGAQFSAWYGLQAGGRVDHGKRLDDWVQVMAATGKLPAAVCGAGASARSIFDQVYAQLPGIRKVNPWRS